MAIFKQSDHSAWYWKFIPHYREVFDYDKDGTPILIKEVDYTSSDQDSAINKDVVDQEKIIVIGEKEINPVDYEFRDEADRKWWSYFNEYEYRFPKKVLKNKSFWRWFDKGTSSAEIKLIWKLDLMIMSFCIISYWAKYVDQANVNNAYVSGMKEDLGMYGNQYANTLAMYNAGAVIFQVFYMYLFPRISMNLMFFAGDLVWSVISIAAAFVHSPQQLYACRFFIGAAEAGYFIMIHYLLGSWYKPDELGRRGGIYYTGQMLGILTAGLLQARIYENMNGYDGRAGWRWAFIIDGLITLPIAVVSLYLVPGTPNNCHSLFLSDDEIRLARRRLIDANIATPSKTPPNFLDKKRWKKIISSWQIYVLSILDALFWNHSNNGSNAFAIWLKDSGKYSVPEVNRLTTIPPALGVFFILAVCFSADFLRSRAKAIFWSVCFNFSASVILAVWFVPESAKWYAFMIGYFGITISSVIYGWMNDIMRHDPQSRSIVLCFSNMFSNQFSAWVSRLTYPTTQAPRYRNGFIFTSVVDAVILIFVWVTLFFYKRQEKKDSRSNGIVLYNTRTGEIPADVSKWLDNDGKLKPYDENGKLIEETESE